MAGELFARLVHRNLLTRSQLSEGILTLLDFAGDLICDIPKFWDYVAQVVAPSVSKGALIAADFFPAAAGVLAKQDDDYPAK